MTHLTKIAPKPFWFTALCLLVFSAPSFATQAEAEITHLLDFIARSGCTFIRNGSEYPAPEARSHMEMKYDYGKEKITRAEQFIEYIATKSSLTGRPYRVRCEGREQPTSEWLSAELERYRKD